MKRFLLAAMAVLALDCAPGAAAQDIDSLMATMSVRQKVAQLFMPDLYPFEDRSDDAEYCQWVDEGIGGLIIMDGSLLPGMERLNMLQNRADIPLLVSIDGEWGMSMRFAEFPKWPRQMQLGALRDESLVYSMGRAIGREMKLIHVGVNFAPVADINVEPDNPVINTRSFGEDRDKVARYAWAYASGMQDEGVSACVKHFPGHGDTRTDSHKGLPLLPYGRDRLDSLELYPFRYAIDRGVDFVMMGHLSVPALDADGTPTSISAAVTDGLLRDELGFKGMVITDALDMEGVRIRFGGNGPQAALAACRAGADILLMPRDLKGSIDLICGAVARGEIPLSSIESRCRRILELKKRQNMFTDEFRRGVELEGLAAAADNAGSRALIAEISRRSLVLVHNRRHSLPLQPGGRAVKRGRVAYLALGASGTTMEDSLKAYTGMDCYALPKDFSAAELEAMRARLSRYSIVILGFHQTDNSPVRNFGIRPEVYDIIGNWAGCQNLVGVYFGNPYALDRMPWYKDFQAFVIAWDDNPFNCAAAAGAICGHFPFEGVLPVSAGGLQAGSAANFFVNQRRWRLIPATQALNCTMRKIIILIALALPLLLSGAKSYAQNVVPGPGQDNQEKVCAFVRSDGRCAGINEDDVCPLFSVVKFPQALYVANCLSESGKSLDDKVPVRKRRLMQDTWSPMLGTFKSRHRFSYAELLRLSLVESDNNACDILFGTFGRPAEVEQYISGIGFPGILIRSTERQQMEDRSTAALNSASPKEMAGLLEWFYQHHDDNEYLAYIWQLMSECNTGLSRLPAAVAEGDSVIHKTGTGFGTATGVAAINDAGIIIHPDGTHSVAVVFVLNHQGRQDSAEALLAERARTLIDETAKDSGK